MDLEQVDPLRALFQRHAAGAIMYNGVEVAHTQQCCHCGIHFVMQKGSGKVRGRCLRCNAFTCGAPACDPCIPWEAKMEMIEAASRE